MLVTALAIVLAACGSNRGTDAAAGTTTSSPSTTAGGPGKTFGTLASPCGPGSASGATDTGVTDSEIKIAYGDDKGATAVPGLNKEMGDTVKAFIAWCNDQGGINGRKIVGNYYDAAITNVSTVMQKACDDKNFMLVGEGFAGDGSAEAIRLGCNLVAVHGFAALPDFANAPEMYAGVPMPIDYWGAHIEFWAAQQFPDKISKVGMFGSTLPATEAFTSKMVEAFKAAGATVLNCGVVTNYTGEPSYLPVAQKFKSCGAEMTYNSIGAGPQLENWLQAMKQSGVNTINLMETPNYTQDFAKWNTAGIADQTYVAVKTQTLENAADVPAMQQYIDIVKADGGSYGGLGIQSASSFLLWATAAKSCGSGLTRQCMVNALSKVHDWTAGGLHGSTDPGNNMPSKCGLVMKLTGTAWKQTAPAKPGDYLCADKYLIKLSPDTWGTKLGADRISTSFLSPNLIKPTA